MFLDCSDFEEVIMSNLDTSGVTNMIGMFQNTNITSLDLSGINTNKVINMNNMFNSCKNLKYLDLRNCKFDNLQNASGIFDGCQNPQIILDISSFKNGDAINFSFFDSVKENLIFCINGGTPEELLNLLKNKGFTFNCSYLPSKEILYDDEQTRKIFPTTNKVNKFNFSSEDHFIRKCEEMNKSDFLLVKDNDNDNIIENLRNEILNGTLTSLLDKMDRQGEDDLIIISLYK